MRHTVDYVNAANFLRTKMMYEHHPLIRRILSKTLDYLERMSFEFSDKELEDDEIQIPQR